METLERLNQPQMLLMVHKMFGLVIKQFIIYNKIQVEMVQMQ
jgi:hypothetical protein